MKERRAHIEAMQLPELSGKQVADLLRKERVIKTQALHDMADWYVYHGNKDVIRQVLINRQFEVKIVLPEELYGADNEASLDITATSIEYTIGCELIGPTWGTDTEKLAWHEVLYESSADPCADPHFIYYMVHYAPAFSDCARRICYGQLLFYDDILAYMRIYARYKDWPSIRYICKDNITKYPCIWKDWSTIDEALEMADKDGPDKAFAFYVDRYHRNYQKSTANVMDFNHRPPRSYRCERVCEGWGSDAIRGKMRIYDVNEPNVTMPVARNVARIWSVLRDGLDITPQCRVNAEHVMAIPLKEVKSQELEFRIGVTARWWDYYLRKNVPMDVNMPFDADLRE